MVSMNIILAFLCGLLTAKATFASRYARAKTHVGIQNSTDVKPFNQPSRPVPNNYLNSKTRPYWVDGGALPDVHFNIGETYAGNLPIDNNGRSLYFWFVPTTNPDASNEITLWLNGGVKGVLPMWFIKPEIAKLWIV